LGGTDNRSMLSEEVKELQSRVIATVRAHQIHTLSKADLRAICTTFLYPPSPPGRTSEVGAAIVAEVQRRKLRSAMLALFNSYLDGFELHDQDISRLGEQLDGLTKSASWRDPDGWANRARRLGLFVAKDAPSIIAATLLASAEKPQTVLAQAGLDTSVRVSGRLAEAAFQLACRACAAAPMEKCTLMQRRLIEWAHDADGRFLFPGSLPNLCAGLLDPWSENEPEKVHQHLLLQVLERAGGGDPRTNPARWRQVQEHSPTAYSTLLRWLTRASVMQFLDIVGRSMTDADSRRMWAYRRAFWTSYLLGSDGAPAIQKAWIAFGKNAAQLARDAARNTADPSLMSFGEQNDKSDMHSALIMEIGDLLIVDWSHSAKYNVWTRGDRGRPELFKSSYPNGALYSAPLQDSHVAPANYTWQKKLAKIIEGKNFYAEKASWRPKNV
jgi:hypothetical protein